MWKLYSALGRGVAIISSPAALASALTPYRIEPKYGVEALWGGNVRYSDLMKERFHVFTTAEQAEVIANCDHLAKQRE